MVVNFDNLDSEIQSPVDMCFDRENNLYVVDNVGNRIVVFDKNYNIKRAVNTFSKNGENDVFQNPNGIYITKSNTIYICDTNSERVVVLNSNFELIKTFISPKSELLGVNYIFKPLKITVDISGNMYIINQNEFNGIMQLDSDGNFINFIGSNRVVFNPIDAFWKSIMSSEQRKKMLQFIPIEYSNISMDNEGFIYTVSASKKEKSPIKRLNLSGQDVLIRNGYIDIEGDIDTVNSDVNKKIKSSFADIVSNDKGTYFALDTAQGRVFAYNQEGFLLYAFAGLGNSAGLFSAPSAIEINGKDLLVLDQTNRSLTVFTETEYAKLIGQADTEFRTGNYTQSEKTWKNVLKYNSNYELAYAQIGSVYLEQGKYSEAMKYFEIGNYRGSKITLLDGYNKAFTELRKVFAQDNLGMIIILCFILSAIYIVIRKFRKSKRR
jgi:hypothetical protein